MPSKPHTSECPSVHVYRVGSSVRADADTDEYSGYGRVEMRRYGTIPTKETQGVLWGNLKSLHSAGLHTRTRRPEGRLVFGKGVELCIARAVLGVEPATSSRQSDQG
jgi:hypothetical protein